MGELGHFQMQDIGTIGPAGLYLPLSERVADDRSLLDNAAMHLVISRDVLAAQSVSSVGCTRCF